MKIRCGSHQQNRSIVRPGLSLMATKVALTAEEFRENSQRSIDLFNTEKLSTNSTHVRKKCILQFCAFLPLQSARSVWRQSSMRMTCIFGRRVAICTERVEAKVYMNLWSNTDPSCNLHGACGGKVLPSTEETERFQLQSARSVWRQSLYPGDVEKVPQVAICTERVEAKEPASHGGRKRKSCNLHGACGGKARQGDPQRGQGGVAICTERVKAKYSHYAYSPLT